MTKVDFSSTLSRRQFIGSCWAALSVQPVLSNPSFAFSPLIGIFARTLISGGVQNASRSAVSASVRVGLQRSGRRIPSSFSGMNPVRQVGYGTGRIATNSTPVWRSFDRSNTVTVRVEIRATLSAEIEIPFNIMVVDLDTGEVEERRERVLSLPLGRVRPFHRDYPGFNRVSQGRKEILAEYIGEVDLSVSVTTDPIILVI